MIYEYILLDKQLPCSTYVFTPKWNIIPTVSSASFTWKHFRITQSDELTLNSPEIFSINHTFIYILIIIIIFICIFLFRDI